MNEMQRAIHDGMAKASRAAMKFQRAAILKKINAKLDETNAPQEPNPENEAWTRALRWVARECL